MLQFSQYLLNSKALDKLILPQNIDQQHRNYQIPSNDNSFIYDSQSKVNKTIQQDASILNETIKQKISSLQAQFSQQVSNSEQDIEKSIQENKQKLDLQLEQIKQNGQEIVKLTDQIQNQKRCEQDVIKLQGLIQQNKQTIADLQRENKEIEEKLPGYSDLITEWKAKNLALSDELVIDDYLDENHPNLPQFIEQIKHLIKIDLKPSEVVEIRKNIIQLQKEQDDNFKQHNKDLDELYRKVQDAIEQRNKQYYQYSDIAKKYIELLTEFQQFMRGANYPDAAEDLLRSKSYNIQEEDANVRRNLDPRKFDKQVLESSRKMAEVRQQIDQVKQQGIDQQEQIIYYHQQIEDALGQSAILQRQNNDLENAIKDINNQINSIDLSKLYPQHSVSSQNPATSQNYNDMQRFDKDKSIEDLRSELMRKEREISQLELSMQQSIRTGMRRADEIAQLRGRAEAKTELERRLADAQMALELSKGSMK